MSYYYKYAFISPEPVYSTVKEELKSYQVYRRINLKNKQRRTVTEEKID